jgi:uncharacterized membrane protein YbhN (UPF0104 family)
MTERPSKPTKNWKGLLLKALLFAGVLYGCTAHLEWEKVETFLGETTWSEFWLIMGIYGVVQALRTLRFYALAPEVPFFQLLLVSTLHVFYLRVLPFRTGELAYAVLLKRSALGSAGKGVAHLAFTRFQDMAVVASIALVGGFLFGGDSYESPLYWLAGIIITGSVVTLYFLPQILNTFSKFVGRSLVMAPTPIRPFLRSIEGYLKDAAEQVGALPVMSLLSSTALTLALWAAAFGVMYTSMLAIGFDPPLGMLLLAGSVTIVASFVPVGLIGTFGVLEAGWVLGFTSTGATPEEAVAGAIVYSLTTLAGAGLLALPSFWGLSSKTHS